MTQFAKTFREKYGLQDRSTADRIARLFKASITPRRPKGRRITLEVGKAAEMRQDGAEWTAVYAAVFPGFASLDKYERTYWTSRLRRNVKAYMKRHGLRCKKHRVRCITPSR